MCSAAGRITHSQWREPGRRRSIIQKCRSAAQSSFRIGGTGVARSTPDYFAIEVMNTILGGSFTSRLNQNLRETHGYTYGAFSGFAMRRQPGPFTAEAEPILPAGAARWLDVRGDPGFDPQALREVAGAERAEPRDCDD